MKRKKTSGKIIWYVVNICVAIVFAFPLIWMFFAAFKTAPQSSGDPFSLWPSPWTLTNFVKGFATGMFSKYLKNSVIITGLTVCGTLLTSSLVAFGFAKLRARGKNVLFFILLASMMIPANVTVLPMFTMWAKLGFVNTFVPLILPSFLGGNAFSIFLLRQFFASMPRELSEATMIDGGNWFSIYTRIYLPNAKPVLFVVAIFSFVSSWNDYFGPLIYLNSPAKYTISLGLQFFQTQNSAAVDRGPMMAMALIAVSPILLLYLFAQKYFVQGIVTSGIKS